MGRSKANAACPNPVFVALLEEWTEEARQAGLKNKEFTYIKA